MAVHTGLLRLETAGDGAVVDLTEGVRSVVERSEVQSGVAVVFAVGATVAVTTIEYEPGAVEDLQTLLDRLIPAAEDYRPGRSAPHAPLPPRYHHDRNAHSHLRAAVIGPSETIPVVGGQLGLGTWQQVVLLDFDDRPRERIVSVQVLS
jgi:secondary thiamine-phosphate synthase enzyme